jgi:signal transduction histidine kinase
MFLKKIHNLKSSLLLRLTILYAITFTILSSIGFMVFYYRIYSVTMDRMDSELQEEIQVYAAVMAETGLEGVRLAIAEEVESEDPAEEFYRLINVKGEILASTDMSSWGTVETSSSLSKLQNEEIKHVFQTITIPELDDKARMISTLIGPDTVLQIGETLEEVDEYLQIFRTLFIILVVILIMVSAITGWFLARQALSDMEAVTQTAEEISRGSYEKRVRVKGRFKEIERLSATFNRMLDRIQGLLRSMKEINDNIAHDLRSPLARIRGIAEMTLLSEKSIDDYKDMAASTMEECDALIEMINTMLDITETEAGVNNVEPQEYEMVTLIQEACEIFRPLADEKKIDLKINLPESMVFRSDRKKMQRILTNILENAIKYTPEHGVVTVSATARNGKLRIDFEDTGIGISEEDLPHIFERFYRCDRSRSQGGVGLGLSLTKVYTESMNGTISVRSTLNQGSTFTLSFVG